MKDENSRLALILTITSCLQMSRWTPTGWTTCLGAAFMHTRFEGRAGSDFELESKARLLLVNPEDYHIKVGRFECIGIAFQEDPKFIRYDYAPDTNSPWLSLGYYERMRLTKGYNDMPNKIPDAPKISTNNKIWDMLQRKDSTPDAPTIRKENGNLVIAAESISSPSLDKKGLIRSCSYLEGGKQLLLSGNNEFAYNLGDHVPAGEYNLSCRFNTVHRIDTPFKVTFLSDGNQPIAAVELAGPYTKGYWQTTEPVKVTLSEATTTMKIQRASSAAVKDYILTPL